MCEVAALLVQFAHLTSPEPLVEESPIFFTACHGPPLWLPEGCVVLPPQKVEQLGVLEPGRGGSVSSHESTGFTWLCLGNMCICAYCGLVGNPHLTTKIYVFAPPPTSTKFRQQS